MHTWCTQVHMHGRIDIRTHVRTEARCTQVHAYPCSYGGKHPSTNMETWKLVVRSKKLDVRKKKCPYPAFEITTQPPVLVKSIRMKMLVQHLSSFRSRIYVKQNQGTNGPVLTLGWELSLSWSNFQAFSPARKVDLSEQNILTDKRNATDFLCQRL